MYIDAGILQDPIACEDPVRSPATATINPHKPFRGALPSQSTFNICSELIWGLW